jgi:hypothetical protein
LVTLIGPSKFTYVGDRDSDEIDMAFQDDIARCLDMISPGFSASLADNFLNSAVLRSILQWLSWAPQAVAREIGHGARLDERPVGRSVSAMRKLISCAGRSQHSHWPEFQDI